MCFPKANTRPFDHEYRRLEHYPAFYCEEGKSEKANEWHFKKAVGFKRAKKRQVEGPLCCSPEVAKFPQESARGTRGHQGKHASPLPSCPVGQEARRAQATVYRIEKKGPGEP